MRTGDDTNLTRDRKRWWTWWQNNVHHFALSRGGLVEVFGGGVWRRGHTQGRLRGDADKCADRS